MITENPIKMILDLLNAIWLIFYTIRYYLFIALIISWIPNIYKRLANIISDHKQSKIIAYQREQYKNAGLNDTDKMSGNEFELWLQVKLQQTDLYDHVEQTDVTNDKGADLILINKDGTKIALQAKQSSNTGESIGTRAIGEVLRGARYYGCEKGIIVTNQYFLNSVYNEVGMKNNVNVALELWDRKKLATMFKDTGSINLPIKKKLTKKGNRDNENYEHNRIPRKRPKILSNEQMIKRLDKHLND